MRYEQHVYGIKLPLLLCSLILGHNAFADDHALTGMQSHTGRRWTWWLAATGRWIVTANETSNSISLVSVTTGEVEDEAACGVRPADIALCLDNQHVVVSSTDSGEITVFHVAGKQLEKVAAISRGISSGWSSSCARWQTLLGRPDCDW